jgi:CubicO group peptidase (beta-lactamase class C family)
VTNPGESSRTVSPDDTFNYGSGTKAVVATAVMRMADAGKLKLSDKVSTYVDPYLQRNNGTTLEQLYGSDIAQATVLQVLRMEAGIPDFEGRGDTMDNVALTSHGEVFPPYAWMRATPQKAVCSPGACSYYSSTSYEVAGLVLAAVQKPNGDYNDLDFGAAISGDSDVLKYPSMKFPGSQGKLKDTISVAGISKSRRTSQTVLWDQNPTIMGWSCGGLNANTRDMARFFYDLLDESSHDPLVSAAARNEMTNLKPLTSGPFKVDYGAGLMDSAPPVYNKPTTKGPEDWGYIMGHIGETFAFHAVNGYMPKAKAALSIVTNTDAGSHTVNTVA